MLVFIDESGDCGMKIGQGSSKFFVVSLVVFEDNDEALACDQRIELLKKELGWTPRSEFHHKGNSDTVRETFIKAVLPYSFFYYSIVLDKEKLWGEGFKNKESFYKYACSLVFENAKDKLDDATIIIDESGSLDFKRKLERYLKENMNKTHRKIKKVKMQRSVTNNLLQLADYVAGIINATQLGKRKRAADHRKLLSVREIYVQVWPTK